VHQLSDRISDLELKSVEIKLIGTVGLTLSMMRRVPYTCLLLFIAAVNGQSYLDGVNYENYAYENANLLNPSSDGLSLTGLGAEAGYTADLIKQGGFALLRDLVSSLFAPKKSENIVLLDDRSDNRAGFVASDLDSRIVHVRQQLKNSIGPAVRSVEADIASSNRDNGILALTNFLGAFSGATNVLTGSNGLANRGSQVLFWAQILYGWGYTISWVENFEDPNLGCGLASLEAAEPTYAFLDYNPNVDPRVKKYFLTEQANRYKKALYCIISKRGSNASANKVDKLIDLLKDLQSEKY